MRAIPAERTRSSGGCATRTPSCSTRSIPSSGCTTACTPSAGRKLSSRSCGCSPATTSITSGRSNGSSQSRQVDALLATCEGPVSMQALLNDLRIAVRQYVRAPAFAATVIGTLALTIGATTAVFSVVNTVLVRALPYPSPERLVWIASVRPDNPSAPFTLPEYMDYRSRTRTLSGLAAYANWSASVAGDGVTERLQGARMSANAFDVLGISPAAGRLLNDGDDR